MYEKEFLQLNVAADSLDSFVICLALGTLKSIREGIFHPEVGVWTVGRPCFWQILENKALVSPKVLEVLQSADEIYALEELGGSPEKIIAMLDQLIASLETSLRSVNEQSWYACWDTTRPSGRSGN